MTDSLLGIISLIIGIALFLIGFDRKTLWELKNENFSDRFNIYEYFISALGFIIVGLYLLIK